MQAGFLLFVLIHAWSFKKVSTSETDYLKLQLLSPPKLQAQANNLWTTITI